MLSDLLSELGRVPWWAWWVILNTGVVCWAGVAQVEELQHERRSVTLAIRAACVVVCACAGVLCVVAYALVQRMENGLWRGSGS